MKKRIIVNLIITVLAVLFVFVDCTNLNPLYPEGAFFWCVMITIYIAVNTLLNSEKFLHLTTETILKEIQFLKDLTVLKNFLSFPLL